jgi:hypothetical protein
LKTRIATPSDGKFSKMELTFIGVIQIVVGLLLLIAGLPRHMFVFLLVSGLFGGSAAILLPALGGSSIPPIQFACLFAYLRILAPSGGASGLLPEATWANRWLVVYTLYGVAAAFVATRLFAGDVNVVPMRFSDATGMFDTVPLVPTAQNITTSVYLVGSLAIAIAAYIVCRLRGGAQALISTGIAVGWLHIALGLAVILAAGTPVGGFFEMFRNGNYAQLNQGYGSFIRIRGLFTESSVFSDFGFAYMVMNAELWYRSVRPKATSCVAMALAAILFLSTSSTAYVALAAYLIFFIVRIIALPHLAEGVRVRQFVIGAFAILVIVALAMVIVPHALAALSDMVQHMTVDKSASDSAQQRLFWALQGWDSFKASYGIGIGPGSFRSSSLITAIMGSTGVVGLTSVGLHLLNVFLPGRRSTYARTADLAQTIGGAFATAAVVSLVPSIVSSASPDLGANFAFLAGAALAMRSVSMREAGAAAPPSDPLNTPERNTRGRRVSLASDS